METIGDAPGPARLRLGGFRGLVTPGAESDFEYGGFAIAEGFWRYREPGATVVVENDRLRVAAVPLTRRHDRVQVLDNAKNMFFSRRKVLVPSAGEVRVALDMRARVVDGRDDDLYAGFASVNLLDFTTGVALDWFVANRRCASVYARLRFPGVPEPQTDDEARPRYFCVFHEPERELSPWERHRYAVAYSRESDTVRFLVDGEEVDRYSDVPVKIDRFLVALGIMTEKQIGEGGSTSLFGQGVVAEWSEVDVEGAAGLA